MQFPRMMRIRQNFPQQQVENVYDTALAEIKSLQLENKIQPGETVAVTCGSRGIANIALITKAIVDGLKEIGATPFIVPAMGSHGGGTAEGQTALLGRYGVTKEYLGCEIRSSMETVIVAETAHGIPVHFDKNAYNADHVFVSGRIKPHTAFVGEIESGLHKMMLIGLGKHNGAKIYHRAIIEYSFTEIIEAVADEVLKKCHICGGMGIVENAFDETALLAAVHPEEMRQREKELLVKAKEWMPRLPFRTVDLLIVDEIGKDVSGSGMDTNVVGRKFNDHVSTDQDDVVSKRIFVRGLSQATHGNANGIGIAEFTNQRTVDSIEWNQTRINAVTGGHPTAGMLPVSFDTDREVIANSFQTIALKPVEKTEIMHIHNTLKVREMLVSEAYLPLLNDRDDLELIHDPVDMKFDAQGNLFNVLP